MKACLTFVHALSPLHAGTGQGVGVIDLPIAREKATNLPFLPGSTLKGTLRDECGGGGGDGDGGGDLCDRIFGLKTIDEQEAYASSANFTDQRLLCLPVRSLMGTFAWVTSPFILRRLARDARDAGVGNDLPGAIPSPSDEEQCHVDAASVLKLRQGREVVLEDLDLTPEDCASAGAWAEWIAARVFPGDAAWRELFRERFCVVHDDVMNFLAETATEVTARNSLAEGTKTVVKGGLWYEESLPPETILAGLLVAVKIKATSEQEVFDVVSRLADKPLQLGGHATVGRGLCHVRVNPQPPATNGEAKEV